MQAKITKLIAEMLASAGFPDVSFSVEASSDPEHGEYASNVALVLAKVQKKNPQRVAEDLAALLRKHAPASIEKIEVAGPGFINFFLSREYFTGEVSQILAEGETYGRNDSLKGQKVMVEYTDPNPFKEFHIGHLMSNTIGESISRLVEFAGAEVKRACYQGDVGLHVAKALWGMKSTPTREVTPLDSLGAEAQARYLGHAYELGAAAYESGEKDEIEVINKKIYDRSDVAINRLYDWGRKVSLDYFEKQYKRLGTKFDFYFFESEMAKPGLAIVREFLEKGVFEESEKAIVFRGEKHDPKLHTRVYITSQGIPTYEAKELALHMAKEKKYRSDLSVVITANEQDAVFSVGLEAFRQIDPPHAARVKHLSHGVLRLPSGKMSSRTGTVITTEWLIAEVGKLVSEKIKDRGYSEIVQKEIIEIVSLAAVKYSILKQSIGGDIIFDFEKSISFEGDSGPYLQYALTRARSVLEKAKREGFYKGPSFVAATKDGPLLDWKTILLERLLIYFPGIVERALKEYSPHLLVTYLTELAASFNNFYAKERIADPNDPHSPYRLALTSAFQTVMKNGLWLLGIAIPQKM